MCNPDRFPVGSRAKYPDHKTQYVKGAPWALGPTWLLVNPSSEHFSSGPALNVRRMLPPPNTCSGSGSFVVPMKPMVTKVSHSTVDAILLPCICSKRGRRAQRQLADRAHGNPMVPHSMSPWCTPSTEGLIVQKVTHLLDLLRGTRKLVLCMRFVNFAELWGTKRSHACLPSQIDALNLCKKQINIRFLQRPYNRAKLAQVLAEDIERAWVCLSLRLTLACHRRRSWI